MIPDGCRVWFPSYSSPKWLQRIGSAAARRPALLAIAALAAVAPAQAHDGAQWIQDQQLRSQTGEWCCGQGDCDPVDKSGFTITSSGYQLVASGETIPFGEIMPLSIDGRLWVCRRPNGTRRCVFDRPPGS